MGHIFEAAAARTPDPDPRSSTVPGEPRETRSTTTLPTIVFE
jgi:hypothetical protein